MSKTLVIVESPAKARTIGRFLGKDTLVQASMGHVRDLPQHSFGVDLEHDFAPQYELTMNGKRVMKTLRAAAGSVQQIYLATDPDREGEAIAWHLQELLKRGTKASFHRITFHEITQTAIQRSLAAPGDVALNLVDAQQARRVLDRIVGYQVSPLLWKNVKKGTSAGRVQSVALRLVVEREREIRAFKPEEYWTLDALFELEKSKATLKTRLVRLNDEKAVVANAEQARVLEEALKDAAVAHRVCKVTQTPRRQSAPPPFITSTLQQACGSALHLGASQTMRIAQELYEGLELGSGGPVGLITYMRTDSVNIAREAQDQARDFIRTAFGAEYVPAKPNVYRSRKTAQEAHEAIRPTDVRRTPESLQNFLTPQQLKVYRIIWNRFVASQMAPAQQIDHVIEVESQGGALATLVWSSNGLTKAPAGGITCAFRASARQTVFPGYLKVYSIKDLGEEDDVDEMTHALPNVTIGMPCSLKDLLKEQCFTAPPNRYSEASLVKALEVNGVGRPSTFATIVNTIQEREYVKKEKGSLVPTELGFQVNDFLVNQMPQLFDIGFTSQMESALDDIEDGKRDWIQMLRGFYEQFQQWQGEHRVVTPSFNNDAVPSLLAAFPADFAFDAAVQRGRRTYDDAKFLTSLRAQLEGGKALSERQVSALYKLVARYMDRVPSLNQLAQQLGLTETLSAMRDSMAEKTQQTTTQMPDALKALFAALKNVTYNEPVKRGRRLFDDAHFVHSLEEQASGGRALSESQFSALFRVSAKYRSQIPQLAELLSQLGGADALSADDTEKKGHEDAADAAKTDAATSETSEERQAKLQALMTMVDDIKTWNSASAHGNRTFDDKKFAMSLRQQFTQKGQLSDKQIAALKKLVAKYSEQIPKFAERSAALGLDAPKPKAVLLAEKCPQCGSRLAQRVAHGRTFVACSGYPKCRYIKRDAK